MSFKKTIYGILLVPCISLTKDTYEPFNLSQDDINAVLAQATITPTDNDQSIPADISFACGDIKYDGNNLKFCECGDGIYMSFRAALLTINDNPQSIVTPCWGIFWHYLKQFNLPFWLVGNQGPSNALALDKFKELGGIYVKSFSDLDHNPTFKQCCVKNFNTTNAIQDYHGIIVYRAHSCTQRDALSAQQFKDQHPEFLFVNNFIRDHVKRKDSTYRAFQKAGLSDFVPQSNTYPKQYSPEIVHNILHDLSAEWLVVKPSFSSLSSGVNIIERTKLDWLLHCLFVDNTKPSNHRCFSHWQHDRSPTFVVAEYAPSKTILVRNKPYDPTMRALFFMHHDQGKLVITVVGGFWKIPIHSLDDDCLLTEKHVTIAHAGAQYSGILIDKPCWKHTQKKLNALLPQLYSSILLEKQPPRTTLLFATAV